MKLQEYIQRMINRNTNGLDITLIILAIMLDISIVCVYHKYMWISEEKDLKSCDIYLVLNKGGHFNPACPRQGFKVLVNIPKECREMFVDTSRDETKSLHEDDPDKYFGPGNLNKLMEKVYIKIYCYDAHINVFNGAILIFRLYYTHGRLPTSRRVDA